MRCSGIFMVIQCHVQCHVNKEGNRNSYLMSLLSGRTTDMRKYESNNICRSLCGERTNDYTVWKYQQKGLNKSSKHTREIF